MFHFGGFPLLRYFIYVIIRNSSLRWFPNSEIHGSMLIYNSPWLIAVSRVLRRLPMPRHSPYALFCLNFLVYISLCKLRFSLANNFFRLFFRFQFFSPFSKKCSFFTNFLGKTFSLVLFYTLSVTYSRK